MHTAHSETQSNIRALQCTGRNQMESFTPFSDDPQGLKVDRRLCMNTFASVITAHGTSQSMSSVTAESHCSVMIHVGHPPPHPPRSWSGDALHLIHTDSKRSRDSINQCLRRRKGSESHCSKGISCCSMGCAVMGNRKTRPRGMYNQDSPLLKLAHTQKNLIPQAE